MSLYKQGVILYIYKKISVYIPYIYTHTYIYVKQQDCLCVWSLCLLCSHDCLAIAHCGDGTAVN